MIEVLRNELWSRMRVQLQHTTSSEQLKIMKVGGETERVVTLFVFEPGSPLPTFCVKTVRRLEDAAVLHREDGPQPHDGDAVSVLIDLQGFPALVVCLREEPGEAP